MKLPSELYSEIFSHLKAESPTFRNLQVAFTCTAFYHELGPDIAERQFVFLASAIDRNAFRVYPRRRRMDRVSFKDFLRAILLPVTTSNQNTVPDGAQPMELELFVKSRHDLDLAWSIQSFLARLQRLGLPIVHRFRLQLEQMSQRKLLRDLGADQPGLTIKQKLAIQKQARREVDEAWGALNDRQRLARALLSLSQCVMEQDGVELEIRNELPTGTHPLVEPLPTTSHLLSANPTGLPSRTTRRTRLLLISLPAPCLITFQHVDALAHQSFHSLTELYLSQRLYTTPTDPAWCILLGRWSFPQLSILFIKHMQFPLPVLLSFLQRNPSVTMCTFMVFGQQAVASTDTLHCPNLRHLTGNPEFLLPLFQSDGVFFPNLKSLGVVQELVSDWAEGPTPSQYCNINDMTTILSCIPRAAPSLHTLSIHLALLEHLQDWLAHPHQTKQRESPSRFRVGSKASTTQLCKVLSHLKRVRTLKLSFPQDPFLNIGNTIGEHNRRFSPLKPSLVIDVLAAFPSLNAAHLHDVFQAPGHTGREWSNAYPDFWPEFSKVWKKATALKKVVIWGGGIEGYCGISPVTLLRKSGSKGESVSRAELDRKMKRHSESPGLPKLEETGTQKGYPRWQIWRRGNSSGQ